MCDYMFSVFLCAAHTLDLFINGAPAEATDASVPPVDWVSCGSFCLVTYTLHFLMVSLITEE